MWKTGISSALTAKIPHELAWRRDTGVVHSAAQPFALSYHAVCPRISKSSNPAATTTTNRCYMPLPALLRPLATDATCRWRRCCDVWWRVIQREGGAAAVASHRSYMPLPALLRLLASGHCCYLSLAGADAKIDGACYKGMAELLQPLAGGATCRRRHCCQGWPPALQGPAALLRLRASGAICSTQRCCQWCREASRQRWVRGGAHGIRRQGRSVVAAWDAGRAECVRG